MKTLGSWRSSTPRRHCHRCTDITSGKVPTPAFVRGTGDAEAAVLPSYSQGQSKHVTPASTTTTVQRVLFCPSPSVLEIPCIHLITLANILQRNESTTLMVYPIPSSIIYCLSVYVFTLNKIQSAHLYLHCTSTDTSAPAIFLLDIT